MTSLLRYATHAGHGKTQTQQHGTGSQEPSLSNRLATFYSATVATYSAPFTVHPPKLRGVCGAIAARLRWGLGVVNRL